MISNKYNIITDVTVDGEQIYLFLDTNISFQKTNNVLIQFFETKRFKLKCFIVKGLIEAS